MKNLHTTPATLLTAPPLHGVLADLLGQRSWETLRASLRLPDVQDAAHPENFGASDAALGLAFLLFDDLCQRVPLAWAYTRECALRGEAVIFDHGAMRTVATDSGPLPMGQAAIARILEPLGYATSEVYPLESLRMTGYVYRHVAWPADLPQFFVSELHTERFSEPFQLAVGDLLATSVDPLGAWAESQLQLLGSGERIERDALARLLPALTACFARQHREATLGEYELFARESAEMAWIATEGHAFNHITDRVLDVEAVADGQRALGRPIKSAVEVSASGRVRQTALRATEVERLFDVDGRFVTKRVPGSFLEFISRSNLDSGELDLAFDSQNAQGIFKMTAGGQQ